MRCFVNEQLSDHDILKIKSPQNKVGGPYAVLYKDQNEGWAAVALTWRKEPRIGIRWFWPPKGNPTSHGVQTWFIVPQSLSIHILQSFDLTIEKYALVMQFLVGKDNEGKNLKNQF